MKKLDLHYSNKPLLPFGSLVKIHIDKKTEDAWFCQLFLPQHYHELVTCRMFPMLRIFHMNLYRTRLVIYHFYGMIHEDFRSKLEESLYKSLILIVVKHHQYS